MTSQVLREYLVALGFKVNQSSATTFDRAVTGMEFKVDRLGKSLRNTALGAQAMVGVFAYQMEKLYYASLRTGAAVGNIQALEHAGTKIGMGAGAMTQALESLGRSFRNTPGLAQMIESWGVPVTGRDMSDVLTDIVAQLRNMPPALASDFAATYFGWDSDTTFMMTTQLEELKKAAEERKRASEQAGIDADRAAAAAREYANELRDILNLFGLLKDKVSISLLPVFKDLASTLKGATLSLIDIIGDAQQQGVGKQVAGVWEELKKDYQRLGKENDYKSWAGIKNMAGRFMEGLGLSSREGVQLSSSAQQRTSGGLFASLEQKYGLPPGILDRYWSVESARGTNMLSKAGAMGHFQFMPSTAQEFGLKNPYDLAESADAAARKLQGLYKRYNGDASLVAAAYNAGEGRVDNYLRGIGPPLAKETQDYVPKITGASLTQTNHITVNGATDPNATARAVGGAVKGAGADIARNFRGAVQ